MHVLSFHLHNFYLFIITDWLFLGKIKHKCIHVLSLNSLGFKLSLPILLRQEKAVNSNCILILQNNIPPYCVIRSIHKIAWDLLGLCCTVLHSCASVCTYVCTIVCPLDVRTYERSFVVVVFFSHSAR